MIPGRWGLINISKGEYEQEMDLLLDANPFSEVFEKRLDRPMVLY